MIDKQARLNIVKVAEELEMASPVTSTVTSKPSFDPDKLKTILEIGKYKILTDFWSGSNGIKGIIASLKF